MFSCSKYGPPLDRSLGFSSPEMGSAKRENPTAPRSRNHGLSSGRIPSESKVSSRDKKVQSAERALLRLAEGLSSLPSGACTPGELIEWQELIQPAPGADPVRRLVTCIEQSAEADRANVMKRSSAWYKDFIAHLISDWRQKVDPVWIQEV